jgi:hypothetical protein
MNLRPGWPRISPNRVRLAEKNRVILRTMHGEAFGHGHVPPMLEGALANLQSLGPDSATMMTSHGAVQGYNSQALIDAKHQVIVQSAPPSFATPPAAAV